MQLESTRASESTCNRLPKKDEVAILRSEAAPRSGAGGESEFVKRAIFSRCLALIKRLREEGDINMRYFKLIVCAAIVLLLAGAASAQEDFINTFAGGGPNDVAAKSAPVYGATNIAVDSAGNVYFSTQYSNYQQRVWKITKSTGILTIVAGSYSYGYGGDGGLAVNALLWTPLGMAVDSKGNVFIADYNNCLVREVTASTGIITTVAGTTVTTTTPPTSACGSGTGSTIGDGGKATKAHLYNPTGVAIDKNGNLFIADYSNQQIRIVSCATVTSTGGACTPNSGQTAGDIYTIAGDGTAGYNGDAKGAT